MVVDGIFWFGFNVYVLLMLALDLIVFNRKAHVVSVKEALIWSAVWITMALIFNGLIYYWFGQTKAIEFLTGYVIEKSLSIDNIFVFVLIFTYFRTPPQYQHKILFWGILGALVMRLIFIFAGVALIEKFHWMIYIFGGFLIFTGYRMFGRQNEDIDPEKNRVIRIFRKIIPVTKNVEGNEFFIRENGKLFATPLFLVLILIETTDVIFAVDSIPAILAITQDEFIVYTSNVFAILGLRSLYFALAHLIDRFIYLTQGLAIVLTFVGLKMILADFIKIPTVISLLVIALVIGGSVIVSFMKTQRNIKRNDNNSLK
jgi:tellurite resistance protein TerC